MKIHLSVLLMVLCGLMACKKSEKSNAVSNENTTETNHLKETVPFPKELVQFTPIPQNPVFTGTGTNTWDTKIRERGFILKEDGIYHMWYTGFPTVILNRYSVYQTFFKSCILVRYRYEQFTTKEVSKS